MKFLDFIQLRFLLRLTIKGDGNLAGSFGLMTYSMM